MELMIGLAVVAITVLGAWLAGRQGGKARVEAKIAAGYVKTRKEIDDENSGIGDDPAVLRDWLRERPRDKR